MTVSVFHYLSYLYFQRTMYKYSTVAITSKMSPASISYDDYYFSGDNYGGGNMPANNKG